MKRTTIFLPDDLHERLRHEAFRARISVAELIRARLRQPAVAHSRASSKDPVLKVAGVCRGPILSRSVDKALYGV